MSRITVYFYRSLPYTAIGIMGFIVGMFFLHITDPHTLAFIFMGIGALFSILDAFAKRALDGDKGIISSKHLNRRQSIELKKIIENRRVFLNNRWILSFICCICVFMCGLIIKLIKHQPSQISFFLTLLAFVFLFMAFPAFITFIAAHNEINKCKLSLEEIEHSEEKKKKAISKLTNSDN